LLYKLTVEICGLGDNFKQQQQSVLRQQRPRINPDRQSIISDISGGQITDEQQNIFSTSVSLIGFSLGLDVFQMPCRTQNCGHRPKSFDILYGYRN